MHTLLIFVRDLQFFPIHLHGLLICVLPKIQIQIFTSSFVREVNGLVQKNIHRAKERRKKKEENTDASYASAASARSSARSKSTSIIAIRRATWTHIRNDSNLFPLF
jgi:hypothetical protein